MNAPASLLFAFALMCVVTAVVMLIGSRRHRRDMARSRMREQWLGTILRSIGDGVIATDAAGRITFMNGVAQDLTGWREEEALQKPLIKVFATLDRMTGEPTPNPIDLVVREGRSTSMTESTLLTARDGAERAVLSNAAPIRGVDNAVTGVVLVFRDVTEHELAESALRASQEIFRLITDHISDFITVLDLEGRRLYSSESHTALLGPLGGLYLQPIFHGIHPEDHERVRQLFAEAVRSVREQRTEFRLVGRDGRIWALESVVTVIRNSASEPEKLLMVSRNIGDRHEAEERVRREKEFSETLINSMPGIFYLYDARRKILRWNKNLEYVTGYSAHEIDTLDPLTYFPDDEKAMVHERMLKCFAEGSADIEVNLLAKDGRRTPFYVTGYRLEVDGRPCMLGIGINITARLAAEQALRGTMLRLRKQNAALAKKARRAASLQGNMPDYLRTITELASETLDVSRVSVWFYDEGRTKVTCADLYEKETGRHSSGKELKATDYPDYFRALKEERAIAADDAATDPRTREFNEGYLQPLNIQSMLDAPIRGSGRTVGVICHEDIGRRRAWLPDEQSFAGSMADLVALSLEVEQRRLAESALRETLDSLEIKVADRTRDLEAANERLQELDHLKSEFLATMSHELRTPLNSIIGFTGILRQGLAGPLNDEQMKQLGMVHSSSRHLLGLINDLLDVSRVESGKMEIFAEEFRVADVVNEVVQVLMPMAEQKKLELEFQIDEPDVVLKTDRKKCFQILLNLANNAVKFTEAGGVFIRVRPEVEQIHFSVSDTGIGIQTESMAHLFEAFRQVDGSARRVYEGTGLGLYLSKLLARMLGGDITVESEFGLGSRFTLVLPRKFSPPTKQP
jgi:PAS domain S-box-containing protein